MQVRLHRDRLPTTHWIDSDLLVVRTIKTRSDSSPRALEINYLKWDKLKVTMMYTDLLLDVDENTQHILIHF